MNRTDTEENFSHKEGGFSFCLAKKECLERGGRKRSMKKIVKEPGKEAEFEMMKEAEKGMEKEEGKEEGYLISETAKLVGVESHVLRYWEEELKLPIRRNELGHRYYTKEDVEQFREIKKLKEQGLQLKAIRTVLTDSSMQIATPFYERQEETSLQEEENRAEVRMDPGEKAMRLQMLLHNLISQAVRENNEELTRQLRETIMKEMDYQFRVQEEENRKRDQEREAREEEHFRHLDEMLRSYPANRRLAGKARREKKNQRQEADMPLPKEQEKEQKKKEEAKQEKTAFRRLGRLSLSKEKKHSAK